MTCEEAGGLLHGFFDGELDLPLSLGVEAHIAGCPACAREHEAAARLRLAMREHPLYHAAPPSLKWRIRAAAEPKYHRWRLAPIRALWMPAAGLATAAVIVLAISSAIRVEHRGPGDTLARQAVADHVRSLMGSHLTDVLSSDQHTVKPWFDGRIDFTPPVRDFRAEGFPLVGGRLDLLDGRPVAAVVYRRRKHAINLFIWPALRASDSAPAARALKGYNLVHFTKSGMNYWAVSSLDGGELMEFARLVRANGRAARAP